MGGSVSEAIHEDEAPEPDTEARDAEARRVI
jgi:hypothetical protein